MADQRLTIDNENHERPTNQRFPCRTCTRSYSKLDHLARHERSHLKQRPFTCSYCDKTFGRQDVLTRHAKLHTEPKDRAMSASTPSSSIRVEEFGTASKTLLATPGTENQSAEAFGLPSPQQWDDSGDILELLMSDFDPNWPVSLPVLPFETSFLPQPSPSASNRIIDQTSPGQHAMNQMSRLVANLSSNLTAELESTGITSVVLDTCLHMFFDKFLPSFPILHKATFSVVESSHPLLLNIIALGSLLVVNKDAVPIGEALWRLAHTAVATSWQALMSTRGPWDQCDGVQLVLTALLGQIYATLSKNTNLRMTSQTFRGLGFYWARQCGMYDVELTTCPDIPSIDATPSLKVEAWKIWASREVQYRAILGHYILDGQISQFSGHEPCVRHVTNSLRAPAPDAAFNASNVDDWLSEMRTQDNSRPSFREVFLALFSDSGGQMVRSLSNFSVRVVLEGLQSLIQEVQECDKPALGNPSKDAIANALNRLYEERLSAYSSSTSVDNMELLIRWHSICLDLATPSTALCRQICNSYGIQQDLYRGNLKYQLNPDLSAWSTSIDGLRAVLHAIAIQDMVEKIPLGRPSAIHLPAALFGSAMIYSARCLAGLPSINMPCHIEWRQVWAAAIPSEVSTQHHATSDSGIAIFLSNVPLPSTIPSNKKNLMYSLNSIQMIFGSMAPRWGVLVEMDGILQRCMMLANEKIRSRT